MARNDAIVAKLILVCSIGTPDTQRLAAMALANLSFHDEVQLAITEAGGLEPVFAILRSDQVDAQLQAARVLVNLSQNVGNRQKIVQNHGLKQFFAMSQSASTELQMLAAQCLANLSTVQGAASSWG
mmetsp:Transcript_44916/g.105893  ORF Transcript_44916/g.105893 Transcript_44916/m.105893 type:complete len:127 (+) Transcript_44916:657-1037(+)